MFCFEEYLRKTIFPHPKQLIMGKNRMKRDHKATHLLNIKSKTHLSASALHHPGGSLPPAVGGG